MLTFHDNGGRTTDRYTMVERTTRGDATMMVMYGFSTNALEADGFNQFGGEVEEKDRTQQLDLLGEEVNFEDLPMSVQIACLQRLDPRHN